MANKKELKSYMAHRMSSGLDCLIQLTTKKMHKLEQS